MSILSCVDCTQIAHLNGASYPITSSPSNRTGQSKQLNSKFRNKFHGITIHKISFLRCRRERIDIANVVAAPLKEPDSHWLAARAEERIDPSDNSRHIFRVRVHSAASAPFPMGFPVFLTHRRECTSRTNARIVNPRCRPTRTHAASRKNTNKREELAEPLG